MEENVKSAPKTIQSSAAAYRDLNATLDNFYEQDVYKRQRSIPSTSICVTTTAANWQSVR